VDCHLLGDKRLAAAGHPTGASFDAGASLAKLVHWDTVYGAAEVNAAARSAGARVAAGGPAAPAGTSASRPAATAAAPAAAKGAPNQASAPAAAPPAASARAAAAPASAGSVAPAAAADPWDWDQPVRPLPKDYVPEPVAESSAAEEPPAAPLPATTPVRSRRAETPAGAQAAAPPPPPSLAEDSPLPGGIPVSLEPAAPPNATAAPRPRAAEVADVRGRAAALLERLLRGGARAPNAAAPARPLEFKGPDSELLRLQDEALALALEALRRPQ
jgi:hypothetical protein